MSANHHLIPKVVKLESDVKERLDRLGEAMHRSPHWLMKEAINQYLEQEEYKEKIKQETLVRWQEAEQGKVVSHVAVSEWLDTWGAKNESNRPTCGS